MPMGVYIRTVEGRKNLSLSHLGKGRKPRIKIFCKGCGKIVEVKQTQGGKYCSRECMKGVELSERESRVCPECGRIFRTLVRGTKKFCTKECWKRSLKYRKVWNEGLSLEKDGRLRKMGRSISLANKGNESLSKAVKEYYRKGGKVYGGVRGQWYESPYAGRVYLKSSYELIVARALDRWNIPWRYEDVMVRYIGEDKKEHTWFVDFHIVGEFEFCIECKGWVSKTDILKWIDFHKQYPNVGLLIVMEKDLWMFKN